MTNPEQAESSRTALSLRGLAACLVIGLGVSSALGAAARFLDDQTGEGAFWEDVLAGTWGVFPNATFVLFGLTLFAVLRGGLRFFLPRACLVSLSILVLATVWGGFAAGQGISSVFSGESARFSEEGDFVHILFVASSRLVLLLVGFYAFLAIFWFRRKIFSPACMAAIKNFLCTPFPLLCILAGVLWTIGIFTQDIARGALLVNAQLCLMLAAFGLSPFLSMPDTPGKKDGKGSVFMERLIYFLRKES